jgi:hypothetical protein
VRASFLAIMAGWIGLAGCTAAQQEAQPPTVDDPSALSLKLKPMMSEQEVIATLGPPKSADFGTCGQTVGKPWACKSLHYGTLPHSLVIQLGMDQARAWRVALLDVY